ncbi:MAG: tRNA (adenosine(37)-N6)-threonylcarbamoyltransferase complex transferase subunit TsaD [Gemmatimonadota bacterium]
MTDPVVLGIETSCDETSAALLCGDSNLLAHLILSQDIHALYGGVVPELAARAHLAVLDDVVEGALREGGIALSDVDAIGVTAGPGLIGALLVGVCWAKAAAFALGKPLVAVHHMEAHLFAPSLEDPEAQPPFVALLVSGGHTLLIHAEGWGRYRLLGETRDDAAGEAFDKVAKLLELPYPGGPRVEALALEGDGERYDFPRPMLRSDQSPEDPAFFDVSFSGLKTAVAIQVQATREEAAFGGARADLAAGFQEAVVDTLVSKTLRAVEATGCRRVLLGGGVSANRRLREQMVARLGESGRVFHATPRLSLDNGAMVARAAAFHLAAGNTAGWDLCADASLPFPGME